MVYLWTVSLLWAFSFGIIKDTLAGVDPYVVSFIRLLLSLVVFLPWLRRRGQGTRFCLALMGLGALQFGIMYVTYIHAFRYLQAYQVALFTIFTPLYVTWVNDLLARRLHRLYLVTALLAVAGTAVIVHRQVSRADFGAGFLLMQASNLCFAMGQVGYRRLLRGQPSRADRDHFAWLYLGAAAITAPMALLRAPAVWGTLSLTQIGALLYLGLLPSGLGFFLWNVGARRVNAGSLAIANNLKIPLAVAVALLVFGEQAPGTRLLTGGALLAGALAVNELMVRRRQRPPRQA